MRQEDLAKKAPQSPRMSRDVTPPHKITGRGTSAALGSVTGMKEEMADTTETGAMVGIDQDTEMTEMMAETETGTCEVAGHTKWTVIGTAVIGTVTDTTIGETGTDTMTAGTATTGTTIGDAVLETTIVTVTTIVDATVAEMTMARGGAVILRMGAGGARSVQLGTAAKMTAKKPLHMAATEVMRKEKPERGDGRAMTKEETTGSLAAPHRQSRCHPFRHPRLMALVAHPAAPAAPIPNRKTPVTSNGDVGPRWLAT
mmetsp:Transcript_4466/g.16001  ORF Transcript_4466/g.16001 Transcript_4466/m.16001 type:complete len:257 (+) Transcript_4466:967-1737(+)